MRKLLLLTVLLLALAVGSAAAQEAPAAELPALADLTAGQWNEMLPGGATGCAYSDPYRFYVRPAAEASDKLLIYFQGGGACWDATTCAPDFKDPSGSDIFKKTVPAGESATYTAGLFAYDNPANPAADYNVVYVPYCTGDIHTGSLSHEYEASGQTYTINHLGAVNAAAALDWAYANYPAPADLLITGSSAGAYGAIFHAPNIIRGDAGVGVIPAGWPGVASWDTAAGLPDDVPGYADITNENLNGRVLYRTAAKAFPDVLFAQYTTYLDTVQIGFYFLQGGGPTPQEAGGAWLTGMRSSLGGLSGSLPNFRSYMAWGSSHTILSSDIFYTYQVNGVPFSAWFTDLIDGGDAPRTVNCSDCNTPELVTP
jgi:hypothetical protein